MDLSIIIVNYRSGDHLLKCLRSLFESDAPITFEVIIVNNDAAELSLGAFQGRPLRQLQSASNVGFAKACNLGIKESSGQYILLLNPDTIAQPGTLYQLYQFIKADTGYGAVGPKILKSDGSIQLEGGRNFPSLRYLFFELFLLRRIFPGLCGGLRLQRWNHNSSRDVPCLLGACMMFPRTLVSKIGYLDETIPLYFEDIDFCRRIILAGLKIHYLSAASVMHLEGHSSRQLDVPARMNLYVMELCQANYLYFKKYRSWLHVQLYRALVFFGSVFRITLTGLGLLLLKAAGKRSKEFSCFTLRKYCAFLVWSFCPKVSDLQGDVL